MVAESPAKSPETPEVPKTAADPAHLPDSELDVMAHLWRQGPATAREIREALATARPMAHASVLTLLGRLEDKRLVSREKIKRGKAFVYRPTRAPAPTYRRLVRQLADRLFGGSSVALVTSLLESRKPSPEELNQLEQMLQQLRRQQNSKTGPDHD